ncbi:MAG: GyrI-like domain-containing protein [Demequina sp.]|nr:GyrI-like domain-containing protein [Demequina sp.]
MAAIDFKKTSDSYQAKHGAFRILEVPPMQYLMVDGHGDPNTSPEYAAAIQALYPVAYKLKFASKKQLGLDYVAPPLEGLWWADDMSAFASGDKSAWDWTAMIMTPDWITAEMFEDARESAQAGRVRLETLGEGRAVQTLHVGPYDAEGPVLARMHDDFIPANGLMMTGTHHEIYLSDPRRVAADKLRTILRQPAA